MQKRYYGDTLRLPILQDPSLIASVMEECAPHRRSLTIPFQSKHLPALKRNVWYAQRRPIDRSRAGFLVIRSGLPCLFVGDKSQIAVLSGSPVTAAEIKGATIFIGTLSAASRSFWIEDLIMWEGSAVEKCFSQRVRMSATWLSQHTDQLTSALKYSIAPWESLSSVEAKGVWILQSDTSQITRLLWNSISPAPTQTPTQAPTPTPTQTPTQQEKEMVAIAIKQNGPDQWLLMSITGKPLGRALVRKFEISSVLKEATQNVKIQWNPAFSKWEIISVI